MGQFTGLQGTIQRCPGRMGGVRRTVLQVMGRLYADNNVVVAARRVGAEAGIHLVYVLLVSSIHTARHDVEKGEHAHQRAIDHLALNQGEIEHTTGAGIDDGGDARRQAHVGRVSRAVEREADREMCVDVDKTGRHVKARDIDDFASMLVGMLASDGADGSQAYRHVHRAVHVVGRVDDMRALEEQVIGGLGRRGGDSQEGAQQGPGYPFRQRQLLEGDLMEVPRAGWVRTAGVARLGATFVPRNSMRSGQGRPSALP